MGDKRSQACPACAIDNLERAISRYEAAFDSNVTEALNQHLMLYGKAYVYQIQDDPLVGGVLDPTKLTIYTAEQAAISRMPDDSEEDHD